MSQAKKKFSRKPASLKTLLWCLVATTMVACGVEFTPKPKGYNRIDLPEPAYQQLQEEHPYTFEFSKYAKIRPDSSSIAQPHWITIIYPEFGANVQLTYKALKNNPKMLNDLVEDARKLTSKHQVKAYSIEETEVKTPKGDVAAVFELTGEVPSQFQFYVTDTTSHFLRGALYFRTATQNDSLAPVIEFMKKDIVHLLNTLEFKGK
ncbi:gliding motility lipoprotein GldD [Pontibacter qinzhouensis]|uniref:Gliding motility lipoprotein GldD n=1 Tax=Pontibacter qinzhouensis TaxID=2603253 RepID=A0A5C8JKP2_9BACT|nr:gliding motility lipoprotein GldD [Pontibacter qinzhouensis]TXK37254.1 gliding motility lipoprotein GldD [Pontibacter qinzhouensis]